MARVNGLAFTPDGSQLVSIGDDKVIRVWDWQAGKTVRTMRGDVASGHQGKIFGVALSPDGAVAVRRSATGQPHPGDPLANAFDWQPGLTRLQPWRPWTCAWVHWSWPHLAVNLAGAAVVASVGWRARAPRTTRGSSARSRRPNGS